MTDFVYVTGAGVVIAVILLIIFGPPYYGYTLVYKPELDSKGNNIPPTTGKKVGGWALMIGWPILLVAALTFFMKRKSGSETMPLVSGTKL
jgi:hypothetical protein